MFGNRTKRALLGLAVGLLGVTPAAPEGTAAQTAQSPGEYLAANYSREERSVPMRDGARLFTVVLTPADASKKYPMLLERTPFGADDFGALYRRGTTGPNMTLVREGYIIVRQELRGTFRSDGTFAYLAPHRAGTRGSADVDESTDTYDTIEWLLANVPGHNGRVGLWGIGYAGFSAAAGMIDVHPAIKAVSPQAPVVDPWSDTFFSGGAFRVAHTLRFVMNYGESVADRRIAFNALHFRGGSDWYRFLLDVGPLSYVDRLYLQGRRAFWNECASRPNYEPFWRSRNILPHLSRTAPAVMTVGGWFDDENLRGAVACYRAIEEKNPSAFNVLVMGPWDHAGWTGGYDAQDGLGSVSFGANTAAFFQENIELPFFEFFLKDKGRRALPEAYVFETGSNAWRAYDRWPPKEARPARLYLGAGGRLSFDPPAAAGEGWDEFVSDPANPVPIASQTSTWPPRAFMVADQRFLAGRGDVLVYATDVLESDVTVAGAVRANLRVSTSQGDADWVVKLVDVFPTEGDDQFPERLALRGYQMLVRAGVLRGRFRESVEKPKPFAAGEPADISVALEDVCHTFRKGHRIMVHVQSSWFPFFDRNPQKYVENIFEASAEDFTEASHRVYRSPAGISYVEIGVVGSP